MKIVCVGSLTPPSGLLHRAKTCRVKKRNYKKLELKQSNFSKDEDDLILRLHALLGNRWSLIAGRLPGRTDTEVRIHWETYLKRKLMKMGIDPTNHRLYHHAKYMSRQYLNSSHKKLETDIISDQSSSVSKSCDLTILPFSRTNCSDDIDSASSSGGRSCLPDLNISLIPAETVISWPVCGLEESSRSSNNGSTRQETLLLFR